MTAPLLAITAAAAAFYFAYRFFDKCIANKALQAQNETLKEQNRKLYDYLPKSIAA